MDFGAAIFFTDYSMGPAELARALEERGFESLWAPEHSHIPLSRRSPFPAGGDLPKKYYDVMDPFVTLAAAAAVTTRLQGGDRHLPGRRSAIPIQTAKAVATLDQVSGGRFLFGIGAGWNAEEMADHGTEFKTRFEVMRERVEAMKAIWTKSKPEYQGELRQLPADDDLAEARAEAAPAGDRGRRLSLRRAARHRLRRRLGAARAPAGLRRRPEPPAGLPQARHGGRARSRHDPDHRVRRRRGRSTSSSATATPASPGSCSTSPRPRRTRCCRCSTAARR